MRVRWTDDLRKYVRDIAPYLTDAQTAAKLTWLTGQLVTADAVANLRKKVLKLKKAPGRGVCAMVSPTSTAPSPLPLSPDIRPRPGPNDEEPLPGANTGRPAR